MAKINIIDVELCSIYNTVRGTMFDNWFRSLNNSYPHYDKNNYRVSFFFLKIYNIQWDLKFFFNDIWKCISYFYGEKYFHFLLVRVILEFMK